MKRFNWIYAFLLMSVCLSAQTVTQKGVTYRYNGKNPRTPIGSVTISYDGNKRSVLSDEKSGSFSLTLENLKMGDRIGLVTVKKREMMVFNQHAVDEWSIRKEPLVLILCNADEFERQKANLVEIGKREAKKKYDRQKAELEAKLSASQMKLQEYEATLDKAYEELEQLQKQIDQNADNLARIDQSELNTQMQEVLDLYIQGDVENAMMKLKTVKLEDALEQSLNDKQHHQESLQKALKDSIQAVHNIRTAIEICKMNYDWEEVIKYQKILADKIGTPHELFQYAYYCSIANMNIEEIETYYNKVIEATKESKKWNIDHLYLYATTLNNLSDLYQSQGLIDKAEKALMEGIEGRRLYARMTQNLDDENHVAWSLVSLGQFYINHEMYQDAERCLAEASNIYKKLFNTYYIGHEFHWSRFYSVFGILYYVTNEISQAECYLKEAFDIAESIAYENPQYHLNHMYRLCFARLANIFKNQGNYLEIESYSKRLIGKYNFYYLKYPRVLKKDYASALCDVSYYTIITGMYADAEKYALDGLKVNPTYHLTATNLAAALLFQGKYKEAEHIYRQYKDELKDSFLDDFKQFAEAGVIPKKYEADVEKIKKILNE